MPAMSRCAQVLGTGSKCRNHPSEGSPYCHLATHDGRVLSTSGGDATPDAPEIDLGGGRETARRINAALQGGADLADIAAELGDLPQRFADLGHSLHLVGGIVRDRMLGDPLTDSTDIDMATDATPDEVRGALEGWADTIWGLGEKYGTVAARKDGRDVEITTYRAEQYDPSSRKPSVRFSDSLRDDLARRDFTFNALAYDLGSGAFVDPFGGLDDLAGGRLRTPLDPESTFSDDPLRMLRAARFAARFGLRPDEDLVAAMGALKDRLGIVAVERVEQEMDKLLSLPDPMKGLSLLRQTGVIELVLPGFTADDERAVSEVPAEHGSNARLAAVTANRLDGGGDPLGHWRMSGAKRRAIRGIAAAARFAPLSNPSNPPDVRRWLRSAGEHAEEGLAVAEHVYPDSAGNIRALRKMARGIRERESGLGDDPLSGHEIISLLGLEPGPRIGEAKRWLREQQIADGPLSRRSAKRLLRKWHEGIGG